MVVRRQRVKLWEELYMVRFSSGPEVLYSTNVSIVFRTIATSYSMTTGGPFAWGKTGRGGEVYHSTPLTAEAKYE